MKVHVASSSLLGLGYIVVGLAWVSSAACTPEDSAGERPGRGVEGVNPGSAGPLAPVETRPAEPTGRPSERGTTPTESSTFAGVPTPAAAPSPSQPGLPPRDLGEELRAMMGQPLECLAGAAPAPLINVTVSTIVDDHGNVLRATASGPLTEQGLACVQARAARVRFRAPVPRAPMNVTAQLAFRMTRPATEATVSVTEEPRVLPPGALDPMGGSAVPIAPRAGRPVEARPGTSVEATQGVSIMGPSGRPIGN